MSDTVQIPFNVVFNSNSVLYDAIGDVKVSYISKFHENNFIYFLNDNKGKYTKYNTIQETSITGIALSGNSSEIYSLITFRDNVYGFNGWDAKYFRDNTVLYVKDNDKLVQESFDRKILITHLSSQSGIRDFLIDDDYNFYVIHTKNKISKFTKEKNLTYSIKVSSNSTNTFSLLGILPNYEIELLKIDYVREYTNEGLKSYPIILGIGQDNQLFLAKIDETNKQIISASYIGLTGSYMKYDENRINYNLTNYEYLKNNYTKTNELVFKLSLQNVFNNRENTIIEIPVNTEKFTSESHHFAYKVDGINGEVSLFCDGHLISAVKITPAKYIFQDIFNESFSVGNTYFYNNVTLSHYLQQPLYYHVNNATIKQFKIYKKALSEMDITYHVYNNLKLQDLVVSMPCGQRNDIEGIDRQFKLDVSGHKSNNVNLIIKNSQITNTTLQNKVKDIILDKIQNVLPATLNVNNIEFR